MISNAEFRARARANLGGSLFHNNWLTAVAIVFVGGLITGAVNLLMAVNPQQIQNMAQGMADSGKMSVTVTASPLLLLAAAILLGGPLSYAFARIFTKRARGWAEGYAFNDLFIGFKENYAGVIGTEALVVLYTLLWSLIPIAGIVLGIMKGYSYSMAIHLKQDHPEWDASTCITCSKELMQGHRWELFCLQFSFLGWFIVGLLCCGVGTLWAEAYEYAAVANFYIHLHDVERQIPMTVNTAEPGATV